MKWNEKYGSNKELEEQGVWVDFGEDCKVKIARLGNEKCSAQIRQSNKPHLRKIRKGDLDSKIAQGILRKAVSKHVLLDWKGIEDADGNAILYSEEKCFELLGDRDFLEDIVELAEDRELFHEDAVEESAGN